MKNALCILAALLAFFLGAPLARVGTESKSAAR